jgi:exodeoxyribonuclease VII large subunit
LKDSSAFVLSVTQLNTYIRSLFDGDSHLSHVFVSGEISNFTNHYRSGHLYFSLKDDKCVVRAVMFSQYAGHLRFLPEDGMKVIVRGRVGVFEASGQYQVYVEDMQPDGLGALNLAFEQMKTRLEKEGLFSQGRKKPLPPFPDTVGVITSPTGAAVHDILTILERRYPAAKVVFCPVKVQGEGAAQEVVEALNRFNRLNCADVLIVGRGGGSIEDLWAFNEEIVARAVADSRIPVISAVGHETDFTICDFAADLRAPTPSAAAELAVPDQAELWAGIKNLQVRMKNAMASTLTEKNSRLKSLMRKRVMQRPQELLELRKIRVDRLSENLTSAMKSQTGEGKARLSELSGRLNALSPLAVLARGYSMAFMGDGTMLSGVKNVSPGDAVCVRMKDGELSCTVNRKTERKIIDSEAMSHGPKNDV